MAELQSRKIPLFECDDTDVPAGPTNGIYADCNDSSAATVVGRSLADWVITDSGGKANTLVVSLPAYPILTTQVNAVQAAFGQDCPTCKVSDLNVTPNDLSSGAVPQDIASYLKTHTDINYVYLVYNGLDNALTSTLQSAGLLNKVKIVGAQPGAPEVQNIIDGSEKAWLEVPRSELMWTLADQMARYSENVWSLSEERQAAVPPMYIVTTPAQAKAIIGFNLGWPGPVGYQDAFKTLWHV
jgi:ribose transport system substrate-binding protein